MDTLKEYTEYGLGLVFNFTHRFLHIDKPFYFKLVLGFWLLLLFYTCKKQFEFLKRKQQVVLVKQKQFEIRKMLKMEEEKLDKVKKMLHASMVEIGPGAKILAELNDLRSLLQDINEQLKKLENMLSFG